MSMKSVWMFVFVIFTQFNCKLVKALVSCNGKIWWIKPLCCQAATREMNKIYVLLNRKNTNDFINKWLCFGMNNNYLLMLWPSSTQALPCNAAKSFEPARKPCSTCKTSHCRSCDVNSAAVPSWFFTWAKQCRSRDVNSRSVPPKSGRNCFGRRASSAARYKLNTWSNKSKKNQHV